MTKDKTELPPPTVPACMLFCDGAIVEAGTGKTTLVGTFSGIAAANFPSPPMDLHIYVQLTSLIGDMPVRLSCIRLGLPEPEEVYSTTQLVQFRGTLIVEQLYIEWKNFRFRRRENTPSSFGARANVSRSAGLSPASRETRACY